MFSHSEIFWSIYSRIQTKYEETSFLSVCSPSAGKCGPEKLQIRTLFTQWLVQATVKWYESIQNFNKFANFILFMSVLLFTIKRCSCLHFSQPAYPFFLQLFQFLYELVRFSEGYQICTVPCKCHAEIPLNKGKTSQKY